MKLEISTIIEKLQMLPHPEGGFYKETYRSKDTCLDDSRNLQTAIYFLSFHVPRNQYTQPKNKH